MRGLELAWSILFGIAPAASQGGMWELKLGVFYPLLNHIAASQEGMWGLKLGMPHTLGHRASRILGEYVDWNFCLSDKLTLPGVPFCGG